MCTGKAHNDKILKGVNLRGCASGRATLYQTLAEDQAALAQACKGSIAGATRAAYYGAYKSVSSGD